MRTVWSQLDSLVALPFAIFLPFTVLTLKFGKGFLVGLGGLVAGILVSLLVRVFLKRVQLEIAVRREVRMELTSEAISHIQMLKQFAWQDATMFKIFAKRAKEMGALRKRGFLIALNTSVVSLFTCLLPSITFSAFIGLGNTLDFATAVSSMVLFQLMIGPLLNMPKAFGEIKDMYASMAKIQRFFKEAEVQGDLLEK